GRCLAGRWRAKSLRRRRICRGGESPDSRPMAKLYFSYAAMNAGKSTILLQASYNYRERGMHTLMFTSSLYAETDEGKITSRLGVASEAELYGAEDDLFDRVERAHTATPISCIFVDEAQFLTKEQVWQLAHVADRLNIPVM